MISVYQVVNERLERGGLEALTTAAVWVDLLEPTPEEEDAVERVLGIEVPTREEMQEIEVSSRLYRHGDVWFMTTPLLRGADTPDAENVAVTFIASRACTVTVRYASPQSFALFANRAMRQSGLAVTPEAVLMGLLETVIDRLADILERIGAELDRVSHQIFRARPRSPDLQEILQAIGRQGDLSSKARDSLLGLGRVASFLAQGEQPLSQREMRERLHTAMHDLRSLSEHANFLSGKISFLLDATLGMINIQQNTIIKIFSVVAVVFLPPTLIASIYGMNFQHMPELEWLPGYPMALGLMVISAILPYLLFKRRGWL